MTDPQRRDLIRDLIERHTRTHAVSRETARNSLIAEGIYTKKGKLRVAYGGGDERALRNR